MGGAQRQRAGWGNGPRVSWPEPQLPHDICGPGRPHPARLRGSSSSPGGGGRSSLGSCRRCFLGTCRSKLGPMSSLLGRHSVDFPDDGCQLPGRPLQSPQLPPPSLSSVPGTGTKRAWLAGRELQPATNSRDTSVVLWGSRGGGRGGSEGFLVGVALSSGREGEQERLVLCPA